MNIQTMREIVRQESPFRLTDGQVVGVDPRGTYTATVREAGGHVHSRVFTCVESLGIDDMVVLARLEGRDRPIILGKVISNHGSRLSRSGTLAPPNNFSALSYPGMVYAQWDTYPGEDLSWEIQYSLTGSPYSDAEQVLISRGSYYIYPCNPGTTVYMRARAVRWLGDNNLMRSGWTGWASVTSADYEVPNLVITLTNKSGGARVATETVIADTGNAESVTTTTTTGDTGVVGVVMESIADDATGLICICGYCEVLIDNTVSVGDYLEATTVAGRARGTAARGSGTFARALTAGTQDDTVWAIVTLGMIAGSGFTPSPTSEGEALVADAALAWTADLTPLWQGEHSFGAGVAFVGASGNNSITIPDNAANALHILDDTAGQTFIQIDTDANCVLIDPACVGINVAIGKTVPVGHVDIEDLTINTTSDYYGLYLMHVKTAGVTDAGDDIYGIYNGITLSQAGGTIGHLTGIYSYAHLIDGTLDGTDFRGGFFEVQQDGGTVGDDVLALYVLADLNTGTVTGDVDGLFCVVDIESGVTSIGGNVIGAYIRVDADTDPGGTTYVLFLSASSNVDYGIYQDGAVDNYFEGDTGIGTDAPDVAFHVKRTNASAQIKVETATAGTASIQALDSSGESVLLRGDSGDSYITAGNFGIGTLTPYDILEASSSEPTIRLRNSKTDYSSTASLNVPHASLEFYMSETSSNYPAVGAAVKAMNEHAYGIAHGLGFFTNYNSATPTEYMRLTSTGKLALGISTASEITGLFQGRGDYGGFMFFEATSIEGSEVTLIPNGTRDVVHMVHFTTVFHCSQDQDEVGYLETPGAGSTTWQIYDDGVNAFVLELYADGHLTVSRSAGAASGRIAAWLVWL